MGASSSVLNIEDADRPRSLGLLLVSRGGRANKGKVGKNCAECGRQVPTLGCVLVGKYFVSFSKSAEFANELS